jgi:hypothetical protein
MGQNNKIKPLATKVQCQVSLNYLCIQTRSILLASLKLLIADLFFTDWGSSPALKGKGKLYVNKILREK